MMLVVLRAPSNDVHSDIIRLHKSKEVGAKSGRFILVKSGDVEAVMIYRGPVEGQRRGTVHIDYHNRQKLKLEPAVVSELTFSKPSLFQIARWAWHAPDVATRLAFKLSLVSITLGLVSFIPTVIPLLRSMVINLL